MKYETEEKFKQAEELLRPEFSYIDDIRDYNQEKVLKAFIIDNLRGFSIIELNL